MKVITKQYPTKLANQVYVLFEDGTHMPLTNCHFYPGSDEYLFGHLYNNKEENTFYFKFCLNDMIKIKDKAYKDAFFIHNSFLKRYDKNGHTYAKCVPLEKKQFILSNNRNNIELVKYGNN